jgi:hypothetical protein
MDPFATKEIGEWGSHTNAQFIVPDLGDKVDYGIVLSYRPVRLHRLAGRYNNRMRQSTLSPSKGL